MTSVLIAPPASEPVTVADMRAHLRLPGNAEDVLLADLVAAARHHIEQETRRALISQGWRHYLDLWPEGRVVALPVAPVLSVETVTTYDLDGNPHVMDPADYVVDLGTCPARLRVRVGGGLPSAQLLGVEIDFTAGYGTHASDVPAPLCQAIRLLAAHWFEHREAGIEIACASLPHGLDRLLSVNRVVRL